MNRSRLASALLLAAFLIPTPAAAQFRHMGWGDSTPGSMDLAFPCADPPGEATLVVSFSSPIAEVTAIEAKIDMCTKPVDLPEWWRFDVPGGCREGTIEVSTDFTSGPASFPAPLTGDVTTSLSIVPGYAWSAAMNRFVVRVLRSSLTPITLTPGEQVYAFRLIFHTPKGTCVGCELPACFVLNGLTVTGPEGTFETTPDDPYTRWQLGQPDCPFVVASAATTWGRMKAGYR